MAGEQSPAPSSVWPARPPSCARPTPRASRALRSLSQPPRPPCPAPRFRRASIGRSGIGPRCGSPGRFPISARACRTFSPLWPAICSSSANSRACASSTCASRRASPFADPPSGSRERVAWPASRKDRWSARSSSRASDFPPKPRPRRCARYARAALTSSRTMSYRPTGLTARSTSASAMSCGHRRVRPANRQEGLVRVQYYRRFDAMRRHHDAVLEAGGTCVMVSLNSVGLVGLEAVRRHASLPIHGHRNG